MHSFKGIQLIRNCPFMPKLYVQKNCIMKNTLYLLLAAFLCYACQPKDLGILSPGIVSEYQITAADTQKFEFNLNKDQFLALIVKQMGIDLKVQILNPSGKMIDEFDSPNGKWGNENVMTYTDTSGIFTVLVLALDPDQPDGKFTFQVLRQEQRATTEDEQVDQLFTFFDQPEHPGAAVSVARDGQIIFSKGYGYASLEYPVPIKPKTVFHIASVSKQFTAFSIAMLADQGKLSLDDDIRKYLPELHDFGETITIRHLVHHTSGLRDQWNLLALAGWRLDDVITNDQIMRLISHQEELNFKPGDRFLYCNTGFTLMAEIVSRVSGMSFADWTRAHIFKQLEMNSTLFYDDHEKIVPDRAYSYAESSGGFKKSVLSYANAGATSLFTTVEDIQQWANNFRTMKVGNEQVMTMMHQRGILNNGDTLSYAFGQGTGEYKGLHQWSHGGADAGYRTFLVRFPKEGYSISVFSNLGSFNSSNMAFKVVDIFMRDLLKEEKTESAIEMEESSTHKVDPSLLEEYTGRYLLRPGLVLEFKLEGGKLIANSTGQPPVLANPKSDTVFYIKEAEATIIFRRDAIGEVSHLILKQGGAKLEGIKMPDFDPSKVDLERYSGTFYSRELETAYTFEVLNDTLTARHQRHDPIKLIPLYNDTFSSNAWFMGEIEFVREKNEITGCLVSSGRVIDVRFEKTNCLK